MTHRIPLWTTFLGACLVAASAHASEPRDQLTAALKGTTCLTCHSMDRKLVGPAFLTIADRYKTETQTPERAEKITADLTRRILKGGSGNWGPVPMPANPQLTEDKAKEIATLILALP